MDMDVGGLVSFSEIAPGELFATPLLGIMRLCLRAVSPVGGKELMRLAVIAPAIDQYQGLPGITDTLTRLAAGHGYLRRDQLMPWNYVPAVG